MNESPRDPRFDPQHASPGGAPMGRFPIPERSGIRAVECVHCGGAIGLTTWEYLNGFLVVCPHCRGYHGKPWGFERTIVAGLFLSVFSFAFTMRPRAAASAIVLFGLLSWLLLELASRDDLNTALIIAAVSTIFLGPVLINAALLVRHQIRLDAAAPTDDAGRSL